MLKFGLKRPIF